MLSVTSKILVFHNVESFFLTHLKKSLCKTFPFFGGGGHEILAQMNFVYVPLQIVRYSQDWPPQKKKHIYRCLKDQIIYQTRGNIRFDIYWVILLLLYFSDTDNIRFVFAAVKDTILQLNLKEYNLVWLLCGCTSCKQKQKNLEVERLTDASISIGQGHFSLWPWSILTDHTHIHTHKKINLEKCPCTWEKKNFWKKKFTKKKEQMNLQCFLMVRCTASEWIKRSLRIFLYILYIHLYIYEYIFIISR